MYKVNLEVFQGPLDLLLHLIEKMEIDIHNVSILELTESYLNYINSLDEISLSNAEEYIVMASSLLHIKSKSLLPKDNVYNTEEELAEEDLVQQLIEYRNYKELCIKFEELKKSRESFGDKMADELILNTTLANMPVESLYKSFKKIVSNIDLEKLNDIKINYRKEISLEKIKKIIIAHLKKNNKVLVNEILINYDTSSEIVASFLSILDLISKNIITIIEENEQIYIKILD